MRINLVRCPFGNQGIGGVPLTLQLDTSKRYLEDRCYSSLTSFQVINTLFQHSSECAPRKRKKQQISRSRFDAGVLLTSIIDHDHA
jgi:hypothetical protein